MMEQTPRHRFWSSRLLLAFCASFLGVAVSTGGWLYYRSRLQDIPPFPPKTTPAVRPAARIMEAPYPANATSPSSGQSETPEAKGPDRIHFDPGYGAQNAGGAAMVRFQEQVKEAALREVAPAFPELRTVLSDTPTGPGEEPTANQNEKRARVVFVLLDAAKKAPAEQRPVILLAADLVAEHLGCYGAFDERTALCDELQKHLARYSIALQNDELGAGLYYAHELLWRIWQEYPRTEWGERVFVLLLNRGWDTSATCEKAEDQTREVIRQGEAFLQQHPKSAYRTAVALLVAEAYASWWSLSAPGEGGMAEYVDPKMYEEGAEEAREKAIGYFEQVSQLAPGTGFSEYANMVLPQLREKHVLDNYRFVCVYD